MADIKALAEELVNLSVKDVQELANILKEEYGIEPAAAASPAPAAGPATATAAAAGSMPYSSLRMFANSCTSFTERFTNSSASALMSAIIVIY